MTSLIDVIFLLLIFFMVTTTLIAPSRKLDLDLPEAKAASSDFKSSPVVIEMASGGEVAVNGESVNLAELEARLGIFAREGKKNAVVRADRQLNYGRVVEVLGLCRANGFSDIGIAIK